MFNSYTLNLNLSHIVESQDLEPFHHKCIITFCVLVPHPEAGPDFFFSTGVAQVGLGLMRGWHEVRVRAHTGRNSINLPFLIHSNNQHRSLSQFLTFLCLHFLFLYVNLHSFRIFVQNNLQKAHLKDKYSTLSQSNRVGPNK